MSFSLHREQSNYIPISLKDNNNSQTAPKKMADAKTTGAYFVGPSSIGLPKQARYGGIKYVQKSYDRRYMFKKVITKGQEIET